ncbi:hypothetical protein T459_21597 [Capsicum annuum]|uniref:Ubiquitin-like protease family profile domain-containing protein n=1 Tax=Capsicum annuum TaxID=4072 RepID=A0A2G2YX25_CAPAN|nr:hypothetical protein FXO37_18563 [Capsicum annuum]PHT74320.1 hypothetical protein T459_21597 [Capsicum annuum]
MVDEVYVFVNYGGEFHWVLAVIVLKKRLIHVYDSFSTSKNRDPCPEIHKLAVMLPTYLSDSGFFEKIERIDWANLDAYKDKMSHRTQIINQHPFVVQYVKSITQQECASLDCGVFLVGYAEYLSEGYAEYLSEGLTVPSAQLNAQTHRLRYATLLWNYGVIKANEGYIINSYDPP